MRALLAFALALWCGAAAAQPLQLMYGPGPIPSLPLAGGGTVTGPIGFGTTSTPLWRVGIDAGTGSFHISNPAIGSNDRLNIDPTTGNIAINTNGAGTAKLHIIDTNSLTQGIRIIQSDNTTGSSTGPVQLNYIGTTFQSSVDSGSQDATATVSGLHVQLGVGGASLNAKELWGLSASVIQTAADTNPGDKVGIGGGVQIGFTSTGKAYGMSSSVTGAAGTTPQAISFEADMNLTGTAVPAARIGINSWQGGTARSSDLTKDAAYAISNSGAVGTNAGGWFNGFLLYSHGSAIPPMDPTGNIFASDAAITVGSVWNMSNVTVTNNIMNFPNVQMTGSGLLGLGTSTTPAGRLEIAQSGNAATDGMVLTRTAATSANFYLSAVDNTLNIGRGGSSWQMGSGGRVITNKGMASTPTALVDGGTITVSAASARVYTLTLTGDHTLGAPASMVAGTELYFIITQDGTGGHTLSYNAVYKWPSGTAPTITTTAGAVSQISCRSADGTNLLCSTVGLGFS